MDPRIDHGPVIVRSRVPVRFEDTSQTLYERVVDREEFLLGRWLPRLISGRYRTRNLASGGTYQDRRAFERMRKLPLNRRMTYGEVIRYLQAMTHPPYGNALVKDPKTGRTWSVSVRMERRI